MDHLVIMGPMGVGKSTTGRSVAEHLGWPYSDSDAEIEQRTGMTGREMVERDGLAALHRLEADVLVQALERPSPTVISAAASTIEDADVRVALGHCARVVFLDAPTDEVITRQSAESHRRAMSAAEHESLMARRDVLFRQAEDLRLSALRSTAELTVDIVAFLGEDDDNGGTHR